MAEESKGTPVLVPMVGKVIAIDVKVGDAVEEGSQIALLEAMKMEIPVVAPVSGSIKELNVSVGETVQADSVLAVIA
ncbi:MAG: biotin/lipoyl-containing protein [Thermodesulfobacteriota bacterium]|nr:biotin/lipoyl-containing protein [Thermodesulfobacteriota bacterium]